jgi:hypothetical protein
VTFIDASGEETRSAALACAFSAAFALVQAILLRATRWSDTRTSVVDALHVNLVAAGLLAATYTWMGSSDRVYRLRSALDLPNSAVALAFLTWIATFVALALVLGVLRRHPPARTYSTALGLATVCALPFMFLR